MTEAVLLAVGLAVGADWRLVAMAAGAVWAPLPTMVALTGAAVIGWRVRRATSGGEEARFAVTVVGELRAGGSLRSALRTACAGRDDCGAIVRRLDIGVPLSAGVEGLAELMPTIGALVASAVTVGAGGGRMLPVFEELVVLATADEQARSELRTATAQVRASMWVLVGGPLAYMAWSIVTGRLSRLVDLPGGLPMAGIGGGLFLVGVAAMAWIGRR